MPTSIIAINLHHAARCGHSITIGGGVFHPGELTAAALAIEQHDQAITHLRKLLNNRRTATQALKQERDARDWLASIGSEAP